MILFYYGVGKKEYEMEKEKKEELKFKTAHEKLSYIQSNISAPKSQFNDYGNYYYRSLDDITYAAKNLLSEVKAQLYFNDEIVLIGDRFYIKATATFRCNETNESISTVAFAREPLSKKGMDESQITGAASSYSRKYAANGLFCLDDGVDNDSTYQGDEEKKEATFTKKVNDAMVAIQGAYNNGHNDEVIKIWNKLEHLDKAQMWNAFTQEWKQALSQLNIGLKGE